MSNCKTKKLLVLLTIYSVLSMAGCGQDNKNAPEPTTLPQVTNAPEHTATPVPTKEPTPTPTIVPGEEWKSNLGTIDLSNLRVSGTGVTVNGTTIRITSGGDFTVTGTLAEGKIVISTTDRVKLRLSGASLTCRMIPPFLWNRQTKHLLPYRTEPPTPFPPKVPRKLPSIPKMI